MKNPDDKVTAELPGIPPVPSKRKYATPAEKQAAYRARKGVTALTIMLPNEVAAEFSAWLKSKDKKPSAVVTKLIQTQLLRKR